VGGSENKGWVSNFCGRFSLKIMIKPLKPSWEPSSCWSTPSATHLSHNLQLFKIQRIRTRDVTAFGDMGMTHLHLSVPGAWHYGSQDSEASEAIEG